LNFSYKAGGETDELTFGLGFAFALLLLAIVATETLVEAVDSAGSVNKSVTAARVEGVAGRRDVENEERIFLAVFPLDRLISANSRAGQELESA